MAEQLSQSQQLIVSGVELAQKLHHQLHQVVEFRKWKASTMALAAVCLGAGSAKVAQLTRADYLLLCETAFDSIEGSQESKEPNP